MSEQQTVRPDVEKALMRYYDSLRENGVAASRSLLKRYSAEFPEFPELAERLHKLLADQVR